MGRPSKSAAKTATRMSNSRSAARQVDVDPDLEMNCEEEELSDAQNIASEHAMAEYRDAMRQIEEARAKLAEAAAAREAAAIAAVAAAAEADVYVNGNGNQYSPVEPCSTRSSSPDVIVLDDDDCIVTTPPPLVVMPSVSTGTGKSSKGRQKGQTIGTAAKGKVHKSSTPSNQGENLGLLSVDVDLWNSVPQGSATSASSLSPVGSSASSSGVGAGGDTDRPGRRVSAKRAASGAVAALTSGFKRGRKKSVISDSAELESVVTTMLAQAAAATTVAPSHHTSGTWIPLDEFYYSSRDGDLAYREEKGEFKFKCSYCHHTLYNNVKLMMHVREHFEDAERAAIFDLKNLTQCSKCDETFEHTYLLKKHMDKVHVEAKTAHNQTCKICEKEVTSENAIRSHMRQIHHACEMPYVCQLCGFRSSAYTDVLEHFVKRHDSSVSLLCVICLKTMNIGVSKKGNYINTSMYFGHMQKHLNRGFDKKCKNCRLSFFSKTEAFAHVQKDHAANSRGLLGDGAGISRYNKTIHDRRVDINVTDSTGLVGAVSANLRHLNVPLAIRATEFKSLKVCSMIDEEYICYECKQPMNKKQHFRNYVHCALCRFASTCRDSYMHHVTQAHGGGVVSHLLARDVRLSEPLYCACGYHTYEGFLMAQHMMSCSRKTCYTVEPTDGRVKVIEYDDLQEDLSDPLAIVDEDIDEEDDEEDENDSSMFKTPSAGSKRASSATGIVVNGIIEELLDNVFPAEAAASYCLMAIMAEVDDQIGAIERASAMRAVGSRRAAAAREQRANARAAAAAEKAAAAAAEKAAAERAKKEASAAEKSSAKSDDASEEQGNEDEEQEEDWPEDHQMTAEYGVGQAVERDGAEQLWDQVMGKGNTQSNKEKIDHIVDVKRAADDEYMETDDGGDFESEEAARYESKIVEDLEGDKDNQNSEAIYKRSDEKEENFDTDESIRQREDLEPSTSEPMDDENNERISDENAKWAAQEEIGDETGERIIHEPGESLMGSWNKDTNDSVPMEQADEIYTDRPNKDADVPVSTEEQRQKEDPGDKSNQDNLIPASLDVNPDKSTELISAKLEAAKHKEVDIPYGEKDGEIGLEKVEGAVPSQTDELTKSTKESDALTETRPESFAQERSGLESLVEEKAAEEHAVLNEPSSEAAESSLRESEPGISQSTYDSSRAETSSTSRDRERSEGSDRHGDSRHGDDRRRDDRHRDDRHGDDRRREDRYKDDRHKEDRHRDDRYGDDRRRDDRYRDDRHRDDRHRDDRHGDDRRREDRNRDDRHRDDRHGDDRRRDDRYRDDRHRDDRHRDDRHRDDRNRSDRRERDRN